MIKSLDYLYCIPMFIKKRIFGRRAFNLTVAGGIKSFLSWYWSSRTLWALPVYFRDEVCELWVMSRDWRWQGFQLSIHHGYWRAVDESSEERNGAEGRERHYFELLNLICEYGVDKRLKNGVKSVIQYV